MTINLTNAPINKRLRIISINAGLTAKQRLISMGIHVGDEIEKINENGRGPVLVRNLTLNSSKIAIGYGLSMKILVNYE